VGCALGKEERPSSGSKAAPYSHIIDLAGKPSGGGGRWIAPMQVVSMVQRPDGIKGLIVFYAIDV